MVMSNKAKIAIVLTSILMSSSAVMAAPAHRVYGTRSTPSDPWVEPIHLDSPAAPAKQYFEEMQRDGN
jgi:hypothetical protein